MPDSDFIPFALPDITDREIRAVVSVLESGWLTTGPTVQRFAEAFAQAVSAPHAVAVNSCTGALHLALEAIGVSRGDEVIVPACTFPATAEVVCYLDAVPVIADIRAADHNLDVSQLERHITSKTRAIIPVHFAGLPCNMEPLEQVARDHCLRVVCDAAHAFPCSYRGRNVGELGDISCFSFYATKTITTGEGGAAVTANQEWAERMRMMCLHGISADAWNRYSSRGRWFYEVISPGYKYNLTDIAAAIGVVQLERSAAMLHRRREIAQVYDEAFRGLEELELLSPPGDRTHAHHLYVMKLNADALSIGRDQFIEELRELGVGASVHFIPLHIHRYYRNRLGYEPNDCPVALDTYQRSISLPIYSRMTNSDVERVVETVLALVRRFVR